MTVVRWGSETLVDAPSAYPQINPSVAGLIGGGYVVVWNEGADYLHEQIKAQIFNAAGQAQGAELTLGTSFGSSSKLGPAVVALPTGGFSVAWRQDINNNGQTYNVGEQQYTASGVASGSGLTITPSFYSATSFQSLRILADPAATVSSPTFAVGMIDTNSNLDIYSSDSRLNNNGINVTPPASGLAVAADDSWAYVTGSGGTAAVDVVFAHDQVRTAKVSTSSGAGLSNPAIATLGSGIDLVAWQEASDNSGATPLPDRSGASIRAQLVEYDNQLETAVFTGSEFAVNTVTAGDQTDPQVTALADGGAVVTWRSTPSVLYGSPSSIEGQLFDAFGNRVGGEFTIVASTTDALMAPVLSSLSDGRLVAVWQDANGVGALHQIILDPRNGLVQGRGAADVLYGSLTQSNEIDGFDGDDRIVGGFGNDQIDGDAGNDLMHGGPGNDYIDGGLGLDTATYAYASSQYVLTRLGPDSWQITGSVEGTDQLVGVERLQFSDKLLTLRNDWTTAAHDANGDGDADLLWQYTPTGQVTVFQMTGTKQTGGGSVGTMPSGYTAVGSGDFNGDGNADLVLRNASTGQNLIWFLKGGTLLGTANPGTVATNWSLAGTGDFNGDAQADLLWRNNTTGEIDAWLMKNGVLQSGGAVGTPGTAFSVVGTGDFDADGRTDVALRNATTGETDIWLMNGAAQKTGSGAVTQSIPTTTNVLGVGDFNGDGQSDLLLQNASSGDLSIYDMLGRQATIPGGSFATLSSVWKLAGTGDLNGDGTSDLAWRNQSTGELDLWVMKNNTLAGGGAFATISNDWKLV